MSDPSPRSAGGASFWSTVRELLHLKAPGSLRESIEEAIDEHLEESADPDDLDQDERTMLRNMLHLSEQQAGDIAVPRSDILAISRDCDFKAIVRQFREAGHSRLPVFEGNLDSVIGMLHVKDIYAVIADRFGKRPAAGFPTMDELLRPVLYVPPSMPVVDLLTEMRRKRTHMAIIVDEYGGTDGLVTIEDIVEEIFGDIRDEYELQTADVPDAIVKLDQKTAELDAAARIIDVNELIEPLGVQLPTSEDYDTVGGFVMTTLGRIPTAGESFAHERMHLTVLEAKPTKVVKVKLEVRDEVAVGEN